MDSTITDTYREENVTLRRRLKDFIAIAALMLASRAILVLIGHAAAAHKGIPGGVDMLCRFDCSWYLSVADHGYSAEEASNQPGATNYGFFPLFPLLIRAATPLFGNAYFSSLYAALTIANLAFLAGLSYVYRYALLVGASRSAALLSIAMICFFPQSIVFSAPYSESLFLLLLAAGIYYLLRERFLVAGIAAALLSAARPTGVLFMFFVIACAVRTSGWRNLLEPWRQPERYVPLLLAPLGLFFFLGYCFMTTGDAFAHSSTELHGWGWRFTTPWRGLQALLRLHGTPFATALCSLVVFAFSLLLLPRRRYAEFVLCLAFFVLMWSSLSVGSLFRYWLVLFPVWVELARRLEGRPVLAAAALAILVTLDGGMMWAWVLQDATAI
jgi:Mannosyltransferase (PIG-V)